MASDLIKFFQSALPIPDGKIPDWMLTDEPSDLSGGLTGGVVRNRIGLKGNRFRLIIAGEEVAKKDEPFLDVVIIKAAKDVSRIFFKDKYNPDVKSTAPTCFSTNGVTPHESVVNKQSSHCGTCPQNVKGSAVTDNNQKSKACSFSKRIVVWLLGDETKTLYQMDLKSMSIYGKGPANSGLYTMTEYVNALAAKRFKYDVVVTRISFDDESSVPKLYFSPQALVKGDVHANIIAPLMASQEASDMVSVEHTASGVEDEPFETPVQKPAVVPPKAKAADPDEVDFGDFLADVEVPALAKLEAPAKAAVKAPAKAAKKEVAPVAETTADDDLMSELDAIL